MKRLRIFLAGQALLLIGASAAAGSTGSLWSGAPPSPGWRLPAWHQFHIERHFQIRIMPGTAAMPPAMIEEIEEEERVEPIDPRRIGKCVGISSIAAVHPGNGDELLLFLRDDRVISASLQKHCTARNFYSGFLIEPNADGAICTGRDILHSRSGDNCMVRRLRAVGSAGYRRFP